MSFERITVVAGGAVYEGWESVQVEISVETIEVNFMLTTTEVTPIGATNQAAFDKWNFVPGTPIEVYANEDLVVSGVVWQYMPMADAEQHSVTIMGKTLSTDFAVSSIVSASGGTYENTTVQAVIAEWATAQGLIVRQYAESDWLAHWQIRQGATGYAESMRMLKARGKLLFGLGDGTMALSDGRTMGVQGPIVQGENIKRMSAKLTDENYHTALAVGQLPVGTSLQQALEPVGMAMSAYGRRKTKLIVEPAAIDQARAAQRAMWEVRRAAGATIQATITVPGWHCPSGSSYIASNLTPESVVEAPVVEGSFGVVYPGTPTAPTILSGTGSMGPLWMVNADTYVYAPWLKIECVLRTYRVVFQQSLADGSTTEMTLVDPMTIDTSSNNQAPCASGNVWSTGFSFAEDIVDTAVDYLEDLPLGGTIPIPR